MLAVLPPWLLHGWGHLGRLPAVTPTSPGSFELPSLFPTLQIGNQTSRNCIDWAPEGATPLNACPVDANSALHSASLSSPIYFYDSAPQPPAQGNYPCAGKLNCCGYWRHAAWAAFLWLQQVANGHAPVLPVPAAPCSCDNVEIARGVFSMADGPVYSEPCM